MTETLIAEDILLLLLDDEKGSLPSTAPSQTVLGGALLVELALGGSVEVEDRTSRWRSAKVHVTETGSVDPVLADAEAIIAEKQRAAADLVDRLGKGLVERLGDRLVERGILERRDGKVLGLFSRTRWPATDMTHERQLREALTSALVQGTTPDERTAAVIALLSAIGWAHRVVDHGGLSAKQVKARAAEIAEGDWAAKAVRDAVAAATAATIAATTAATSATTVSGT